jgi:protein disulfide-isomerase A6
LSNFFDSILDGSVDLKTANDKANAEEFTPDEKELEIERKQEAQRIALAHGGFTDLIDFEKAIKEGHGADYHDIHGYPGMMGQPPKKKSNNVEKEEVSDDSGDILTEEASYARISDEL